jgi:uncharacterized SAM-binding protein YcdF (DUF218 family)
MHKHWADVILILGCGFRGNSLGTESKLRVKQGVKMYKDGFAKNLIMTGGTSRKKSLSKLMKDYAIGLGVPSRRIFIEEQSKDTVGNAIFSKQILKKNKWKNVLLVTSDYHVERSMFIFHHVLGKNYNIMASDVSTGLFPKLFSRENKKLLLADGLFSGIGEGKDAVIKKRLLASPLY